MAGPTPVPLGIEVEVRVGPDHRAMQLAGLLVGLEAELTRQPFPQLVVDLDGFGLPAISVEGQHKQADQAVAQRMAVAEVDQTADNITVAATRELCLQLHLHCAQVQFVQAGRNPLPQQVGGDVAEDRPAPQGQSLAQCGRPGRRVDHSLGLVDLVTELVHVDGERVDGGEIGVTTSDDPQAFRLGSVWLQPSSDPRHIDPELSQCGVRRVCVPEQVNEPVDVHRSAHIQQQQPE